MLNLVTSFTKLGTAAVLLLVLAGAAVWFTAQQALRAAAPPGLDPGCGRRPGGDRVVGQGPARRAMSLS